MNKTELIVFKYKQTAELEFQDTYLASSSFGLKLGLEFSSNTTNELSLGQKITIDKTNKSINPWADGETEIIGIEPSTLYIGGITIFTNVDLQLPISFTSGENGKVIFASENRQYEIYESLDLFDNEQFPLTFSIADITSPEKRNSSFSKTITIPGTKNNNVFFKNIFEIGADLEYDPRKKAQFVIYSEGLEQLSGYLQLTKIVRDDFNNIKYEINLYGQLANIFYNLGEDKMCGLNFFEYTHTYNFGSILNSWNTNIQKNGSNYINWTTGNTQTFIDTQFNNGKVNLIYGSAHNYSIGETIWVEKADPTINHIYNGISTIIDVPNSTTITINKGWGENSLNESGTTYVKCQTGEGYVYPIIDYGKKTLFGNSILRNGYGVQDFYPSIYLKTIIDKIFENAQFTYQSDFFDSCYFKRLIVPYTGEYFPKSTQQIQRQEFRAGLTGATFVYAKPVGTTQFNEIFTSFNADTSGSTFPDLFDNFNNYNPALNSRRFISQYTTEMKFQADFQFRIQLLPIAGTPSAGFWQYSNLAGDEWGQIEVEFQIIKKRNGVETIVASNVEIYDTINIQIPTQTTSAQGYVSPYLSISVQTEGVQIDISDEVFPRILIRNSNNLAGSNLLENAFYKNGAIIRILFEDSVSSRFYNAVSNNRIFEGNQIDLNEFFDCGVKQSDFLLSIIKLFNLYIDDVKGQTNVVRVEPRNDYYSQGSVIDWSKKLDISQSINITPLSDVVSKDFELSYKNDTDYWNDNYSKKYNEIYGNYEFTTDNDFVKGNTKIEVLFSPTPQIEDSTKKISFPQITKEVNSENGVTYIKPKTNLRVLYYGGLKSYRGYDFTNINKNRLWYGSSLNSGTVFTDLEYYPYCGMEDDGYISYTSLVFGIPLISYYQRQSYTNGTLFNRYYRSYYFEILDKNSKSVEANFYLTQRDIFELDFRNTINIDGQYYRLNKISDYNPMSNNTTSVSLIKLLDVLIFQQQVKDINNGNDNIFDDVVEDKNPVNQFNRPLTNNDINIIGQQNNISSLNQNIFVQGDGNTILQGTYNSSIIGGRNNLIYGNVENVSIIGTNNATITDSNVTIINGVKYQNGIMLPAMNINDAGLDQVFSLSSSITANIWDASVDTVINIGSPLTNNMIDGSLDISYQI